MHHIKHFKTITRHRHMVMRSCFRVGLIRQGLCHDLSKYSPTEFWQGAKYYQGSRSPNAGAREAVGYSTAWMHHKGRNKHHYEYWSDLSPKTRRYETLLSTISPFCWPYWSLILVMSSTSMTSNANVLPSVLFS